MRIPSSRLLALSCFSPRSLLGSSRVQSPNNQAGLPAPAFDTDSFPMARDSAK
jgi:hypothetical protein